MVTLYNPAILVYLLALRCICFSLFGIDRNGVLHINLETHPPRIEVVIHVMGEDTLLRAPSIFFIFFWYFYFLFFFSFLFFAHFV
ncbi:hypothetical protein HOY80DRAFT_120284 [Tuber brumale]|nr:hypothetical protein HOY80DRAFT_120284 [Tuber brumale]